VVIGNTQWMTEQGVTLEPSTLGEVARLEEGGCTVVVAAVAGQAVAVIAIADALKPESRRVVAALHRMGMRVWMITGDSRWVGGLTGGC
jgi:P-type E1-E2 ATPase